MTPVKGSSLGPLGRRLPQVPGGTEKRQHLAHRVPGAAPNTREASRMLIPSTITALRTRRYTSHLVHPSHHPWVWIQPYE